MNAKADVDTKVGCGGKAAVCLTTLSTCEKLCDLTATLQVFIN